MAFTRGDAKSSRQIGLTRLYCPHGTTQIIQLYRDREGDRTASSNLWQGVLQHRELDEEARKKLSESNATNVLNLDKASKKMVLHSWEPFPSFPTRFL